MNSSDLYTAAASYLGFFGEADERSLGMLRDGMDEARSLSRFRAVYKKYNEPLPFLRGEAYAELLSGCSGYCLVAMTLGVEIDRRVRALMKIYPERAVVLDACASALIEYEGDRWEERFGSERTYRFCPGYGGSSVNDVRPIFAELHAEKIGMQLLDSGLIVPQKSMAGVIGLGKRTKRACGMCMLREKCCFLKEGRRCFGPEQM